MKKKESILKMKQKYEGCIYEYRQGEADMKNKLMHEKYPYAFLYIWMTFICLMIVFVYIFIRGGGALSRWFFANVWDTGNDFFNCIPAVKGYGLGYGLISMYPPLAKLFFLCAAHIYGYHNIPLDTALRNSMTDPRMQQAALVPFIIFILFTSIVMILLVSGMFKEEKHAAAIGASIIGTYSILFAIERGNVIYLAGLFLMYFIAYCQSGNRVQREAALISLALSAGLKLYPAAFGILLLYQKRWKEAGRAVIYGILALVLPYMAIRNILPEGEAGANGIMEWAATCMNRLFADRPVQQQIFFAIAIAAGLAGTAVIGIMSSKQWIKAFYAGVLAMICGVQFTYAYSYVFFIPSLVLFLKEEKKINRKTLVYFAAICMIHLPLPVFGMSMYAGLPLAGEVKMWALLAMMILVTLLEFPKCKKIKENKE